MPSNRQPFYQVCWFQIWGRVWDIYLQLLKAFLLQTAVCLKTGEEKLYWDMCWPYCRGVAVGWYFIMIIMASLGMTYPNWECLNMFERFCNNLQTAKELYGYLYCTPMWDVQNQQVYQEWSRSIKLSSGDLGSSTPPRAALSDLAGRMRRSFFHVSESTENLVPRGIGVWQNVDAKVEGYGELMEDWLQSRTKQLNEEKLRQWRGPGVCLRIRSCMWKVTCRVDHEVTMIYIYSLESTCLENYAKYDQIWYHWNQVL